jgi:hypothetical protein
MHTPGDIQNSRKTHIKEQHHEQIEIDALSTLGYSGNISVPDSTIGSCITRAIHELLQRLPEKMAAMRC